MSSHHNFHMKNSTKQVRREIKARNKVWSSRAAAVASHPKKQQPNAKCACKSGKKFKKCCKNKGPTKTYVNIADHLTPFKKWCEAYGPEMDYDFNPRTNNNIVSQVMEHHQMIGQYKNPSFVSSHPKFLKPEDIRNFCEARDIDIKDLKLLKNETHGWFSLCFQNAFAWTKMKGCGKPKIGWLLNAFPDGMAMTTNNTNNDIDFGDMDRKFSAELHLVYEAPDGTITDPTQDYNPTIETKVWLPDAQLQESLDLNDCQDNYYVYMNVIGNILRMTPKGSGFLHKATMDMTFPIFMFEGVFFD